MREEPGDNWTPTEADVQDAVDAWNKFAPEEYKGLLEAEVVEAEDDAEDEVETFLAQVLRHAIQLAAAYRPFPLFLVLEEFAHLYLIERELELNGDSREVEVVHLVRAHGCAKHANRRLDGYGYRIKGEKKVFKTLPAFEVCEELRVYPDLSGASQLAERAEAYFREHLADKLLFALDQLLLESTYAAVGQPVPAAKLRVLERIGSMVDKCPSLQSRKRGSPQKKITAGAVRAAFKELGNSASQKAVAFRLGVTTKGLSSWGKQKGMSTWKEMAKRYSNTERK